MAYLIGIFLLIFATLTLFKRGYFHLGSELKKEQGPTLLHIAFAFLIFLAVKIVITPLLIFFYFLFIDGEVSNVSIESLDNATKSWISVIEIFILTLVLSLFSRFVEYTNRIKIWDFGQLRPSLAFVKGAACWLLVFPWVIIITTLTNALVQSIAPHEPVEQVAISHLKQLRDMPLLFTLSLIQVATLVPLAEELIFRGFVQGALRKWLTPYQAIAGASMIFAVMHFHPDQGLRNFDLIASIFALSWFLGFVYEKYRCLWASIGLHAVFNSISMILFFFFS